MFLGKKDNNLKIIDFGAGTSDTSKQNHKVGSVSDSTYRYITLPQKC